MASRRPVGVVGAGTMGAGIAQVIAMAGQGVRLYDADPGVAVHAVSRIRERVQAQADRGRLAVDIDALALEAVGSLSDLADADVVVEAIVEDLDAKRELFTTLEGIVGPDCILASNTSSLSPTAIAAPLVHPGRPVGLHFFNPAPVMRLVEVVSGLATNPEVADAASRLASGWGKTVVRSAPTPGFIVNRVARPFYGEAWRLYEEGAADPATIDAVLTGAGFRMGPFALMDLIGHDVNLAVTRQVWTALGHDPRFMPSIAQQGLVDAGWLGRKAGRGALEHAGPAAAPRGQARVPVGQERSPSAVVDHDASDLRALLTRTGIAVVACGNTGDEGARCGHAPGVVELPSGARLVRCHGTPATKLAQHYGVPVVVVDRTLDDASATAIAIAASDGCPSAARDEAVALLEAAGLAVHQIDDTPGLVVTRTVAMLVNLALDAVQVGVASEADVDTAMRLGTNYPVGPLEWGDRWGGGEVHRVLTELQEAYGDPRYRPSPLLRRRVLAGQRLAGQRPAGSGAGE